MKKPEIFIIIFFLSIFGYSTSIRISERLKYISHKITKTTTALFETTPIPQNNNEDAADDPAIWINKNKPEESRIIGTDKKGGLAVYNMEGKQLFYYPDGMMNNVDLRYNFLLGNDTIDILCASNRSTKSISIYKIENDGKLKEISARTIVSGMQDNVYGFCMYKSPATKKHYAFINSKLGEVEQWELFATDSLVDAKPVRELRLGTQVEGMVADDENQTLFIGEEVNGIWKFNAEPDNAAEVKKLDKSSESDNINITFDIEGLAIYYLPQGEGYLLASVQGNHSYAVYNRKSPHEYIGSFRIIEGEIDGAEETDGLDIYSFEINNNFKHGLLVVQDGYNFDGDRSMPQNFKLVAWEDIAKLFDPVLKEN